MKRFGHRGAAGLVAENTLASISEALKHNVDGIEIDVHCCRSGELVVIHDETLERTTNGTGKVADYTLQKLQQFTTKEGFAIPTLQEVLDLINTRCDLNIELKGKDTALPAIKLLEEYVQKTTWKHEHFIISSFDHPQLFEVKKKTSNFKLGVLTEENITQALPVAKALEAFAIHPPIATLTKDEVGLAKEQGFEVYGMDGQSSGTGRANKIVEDRCHHHRFSEFYVMNYDLIVVGGGAAGFFTAINVAERHPALKIAILERGKEVLTKVRVSGGGRCNVTHAEFVPNELSKNYPRGEKELKGPFHTFMTGDTMDWFNRRGVALKIEEDGRIFPVSDSSQTIIDCFLSEARRLQIEILTNHTVKGFCKENDDWKIQTNQSDFYATNLMIAAGSNPKIWKLLRELKHTIIDAVPSLFTFNIKDKRIASLSGIATNAVVRVRNSKLFSQGPLLITHWGMSGPAILKLSAWGAIELNTYQYDFEIEVNWLQHDTKEEAITALKTYKEQNPKQQIFKYALFGLPKRLWQSLVTVSGIDSDTRWADVNKIQLTAFSEQLTRGIFHVIGKSTFKEEFVTAGGIDLKEVNFKTFESKKHQNLYFAGEVLNIDAITGGFNFQNAWTGAFIAARAIADKFASL